MTADPLITDTYAFEVEMAIGNLKSLKSLCSDQIPRELIQVEGKKLRYEVPKLNNCIWNKET
jgi:hypothetical protein